VSLKLNFANIGGIAGQDVSSSFGNVGEQIVEVQPACPPIPLQAAPNGELSGSCPVPEPTTILGSVVALVFGATLKPKLKPSKSTKKETEKFS
jgi:hypothetical protein